METPNIKELLTSFSPSGDFLAISAGDGRIKIWDTLKGSLQIEFADINSKTDGMDLSGHSKRGHLSLDYTCMEWMTLGTQKKSLSLVLGTGNGDVLALDVSVGEMKWRVNDCHPGGVHAISFSRHRACIYTAGSDGMVCRLNSDTGTVLGKFKAFSKAISSLALSPDGDMLATAAAQLKVFNCSAYKQVQKFSGHPVSVRCMIFTEDRKYIISSGVEERYVAIWKIDGGRKESASCVLSMEQPAICLDSKGTDSKGISFLAVSETGFCYFWYGNEVEKLHPKPVKISVSASFIDPNVTKSRRGMMPAIFAANIQNSGKEDLGTVYVAYGSIIKPEFEKISMKPDSDVTLKLSSKGGLLLITRSDASQKSKLAISQVTALDRANAEDAILPIPKLRDSHEKNQKHEEMDFSHEQIVADVEDDSEGKSKLHYRKADGEEDHTMEEKLLSMGILNESVGNDHEGIRHTLFPNDQSMNSSWLTEAYQCFDSLFTDHDISAKKIRFAIKSMSSNDACKFLAFMVSMLKSRSINASHVLPSIHGILVNHGRYIAAKEPYKQLLDTLHEITSARSSIIQPMLQLSGRLDLVMSQITARKGETQIISEVAHDQAIVEMEEDEIEDEEQDDINEYVYGEDNSESESDVDDNQ
ncbi:WD repeat-containing protein 43 isoform X1 [Amborella trichopoda]|uniref:Small-subunit processome Utp12 domain-containing protein n=1 Tax=Amborella trichopoda TaxID=13333 RepID=W1P6C2_AMBTC|nr:WD repeat-containing protein 43 isoform X1 [Amborella trichopoda]XP_020521049.1 WD repeat-containing protein 43 isoform X1 [Amborella trichopoda]XP_020521050.1 WD repeat-containing protein 43 isoform X1 [Amborella trichopoda]XP_020521051.1 WD repeat-containing protein 43 isoform X1 [Amborella trichopoda]ERN03194.1 hypothetical protein AMTR_s00003p00144740 [Amborella trichopoda]|eukprot:XP_006841519.1 WD repeat-containing protein 43 isoform X1 [Amborella trichopoda]